jgi:hypothetical protein
MSSGFFSSRHWEVDRGDLRSRGQRWTVDQLAIVLLSPLALWLISDGGAVARWGFVVGLVAQPFWIYATARSRQLGAFLISVLYLAIWIRGIVHFFPELRSWI